MTIPRKGRRFTSLVPNGDVLNSISSAQNTAFYFNTYLGSCDSFFTLSHSRRTHSDSFFVWILFLYFLICYTLCIMFQSWMIIHEKVEFFLHFCSLLHYFLLNIDIWLVIPYEAEKYDFIYEIKNNYIYCLIE